MQKPTIPTYASDGRRLRAYSLDAVKRLESLSLVVVRRNRHAEIVCAHFRPMDGANPLRATANMGQKYSYLEHVGEDGARAWSHKPLIQRQDIEELTGVPLDSPEDLDMYLRGIFRGVALSVMTPAAAPEPNPKPPKVVPIDSPRKSKRRPIQYDSEGRTAA